MESIQMADSSSSTSFCQGMSGENARLCSPGCFVIVIFILDHAVFISVKKAGMKGCGNIDTIGIMTGRTGMQTVAVAEKPLTGLQVIDGIVDLILHLAMKENRQLNFFMPVPEKRLSFLAGKLFVAYVDRESIGSVRL